MAQYSLNLSDKFYLELRQLAKEHDKTVRELMINLLKAGLVALEAHDNPNKQLCFKITKDDKWHWI